MTRIIECPVKEEDISNGISPVLDRHLEGKSGRDVLKAICDGIWRSMKNPVQDRAVPINR